MVQPYYDDGQITIYHGDCREVLPTLIETVDLVMTDPPFAEETHQGARTEGKRRQAGGMEPAKVLIGFDSFTEADQRECFDAIGAIARGWVIATMDWRHIYAFDRQPPQGLRFVRFGIWVKPNGAPQFTGDRPGTGWEGVAVMHREGGRMRWNGGGHRAVWTHNTDTSGIHPTAKPLSLYYEWLRLFSNPGDLVVDPFMGSGTALRASKDCGRRAIGIEANEEYCEIAVRRLQQSVLPLDAA